MICLPNSLYYNEVDTQFEATSGTWTDLGGPSVNIDIPTNSLVRISAYTECQNGSGVGGGAMVFEATDFPSGNSDLLIEPGVQTTWTPGFVTASAYYATSGNRTYALWYQARFAPGHSVDALFRNSRLWVEVITPTS